MPDRSSRETLARQWELLKLLPSHPSWRTASELTRKLAESGFETSKRTVERDLADLERIFPLERNDKGRPYGWRWLRGTDAGLPGVALAEALSLTLLERFLKQMLPLSLWRAFEPRLVHAREKLETLTEGNEAARWREKVRYVSPTLPLEPPPIDEAVLETVQRALLKDRQLEVRYSGAGNAEAKTLTLHPLGLVERGAVAYLVATAFDYADVRYFAVHRIQSAEVGLDPARRPDGFSIDGYLAAGGGQFVSNEHAERIRLEARVVPALARILAETPLSADMVLETDDEDPRVTATMPDSWALRWWILSQGSRMEVLAPKSLRGEIAHEAANMAALYTRATR